MTGPERRDAKMATLYELRLIFMTDERTEFSKEEILDILDKLALAKDQ